MKCPECKDDDAVSRLEAMKLAPDLAALGCAQCEGALLSLVAYRLWSETRDENPDTAQSCVESSPPSDGVAALICPRCQRIMTKYRYTIDTAHRIDLCAHCDEVWLQGSEWDYLQAHGLQRSLSTVFTRPWQRKLRDARTQEKLDDDWEAKLGLEVHQKLKELSSWISEHPRRDQILRFLNTVTTAR